LFLPAEGLLCLTEKLKEHVNDLKAQPPLSPPSDITGERRAVRHMWHSKKKCEEATQKSIMLNSWLA
jgi:hypothetical protein